MLASLEVSIESVFYKFSYVGHQKFAYEGTITNEPGIKAFIESMKKNKILQKVTNSCSTEIDVYR